MVFLLSKQYSNYLVLIKIMSIKADKPKVLCPVYTYAHVRAQVWKQSFTCLHYLPVYTDVRKHVRAHVRAHLICSVNRQSKYIVILISFSTRFEFSKHVRAHVRAHFRSVNSMFMFMFMFVFGKIRSRIEKDKHKRAHVRAHVWKNFVV